MDRHGWFLGFTKNFCVYGAWHETAKMKCPKHNKVMTEAKSEPLVAGFWARVCQWLFSLQNKLSKQGIRVSCTVHSLSLAPLRTGAETPVRALQFVVSGACGNTLPQSAVMSELLSAKVKLKQTETITAGKVEKLIGALSMLVRHSQGWVLFFFFLPFRSQKIAPKVERFFKKTFANVH